MPEWNKQPKPTGEERSKSTTDFLVVELSKLHTEIAGLVAEDAKSRREFGRGKYGTELMTFNGRDALQDGYEEILDLLVYLSQALMEETLLREEALSRDGQAWGTDKQELLRECLENSMQTAVSMKHLLRQRDERL